MLPHQKFQSPQTHTKRKKIINKKILQTLQMKYYKYQYKDVHQIYHRIKMFSHNQYLFIQHALQKSDFTEQLKYIASHNNRENAKEKKWSKRKTIWSNPQYSMSVRTNIEKIFLKLMRKHFPNGSPLQKIFNKNSYKLKRLQ